MDQGLYLIDTNVLVIDLRPIRGPGRNSRRDTRMTGIGGREVSCALPGRLVRGMRA